MEKENPITLTIHESIILLISTFFIAILYAICFDGVDIKPQLSFTVFCIITFIILHVTLKKIGYYKNKQAIKWVIPIVLISLLNSVFHESIFTYGNVLIINVLFAIFIMSTIKHQNLLNLNGFFKILCTIFGNWFIFVYVFRKVGESRLKTIKSNTTKKIVMGICFALPIIIILIVLLSSADLLFKDVIDKIISSLFDFDSLNLSFILIFVIVWIFAIGYVIEAKKNCEREDIFLAPTYVDFVIGATFLIMVNLVFLLFSYVQIAYLFRGGFMTLPNEMVYSQYAREGFFQLLLVTIINFSVIIAFISFFKNTTNSKLLRILLLMLCFFTCVLIVSSFYRMFLYIDVYGHTTLRLSVITFLVMEVFLIGITVAKIFFEKISFEKYFLTIGFVFYLMVNVTGSDYMATKLNINRVLANKQDIVDVSLCNEDGFYLIKSYVASGKLKPEMLSHSSFLSIDKSVFNENYSFKQWQNWSYFKYN